MAPVQTPALFLCHRTISVAPALANTASQLIVDGEYDYVNPGVSEHFSFGTDDDTYTIEVHLLRYKKVMTSERIVADMDHKGWRPATFLKLLQLGAQYPGLQRKLPVVALGTVVQVNGSRRVTYLGSRRGRRRLDWYSFDRKWRSYYRFAAVSEAR